MTVNDTATRIDDDLLDVAPADPAELYSLVATSSGAQPQVFAGVRDTARQDWEAEAIFGIRSVTGRAART